MHADRRFMSHFDWGTLILTLMLVSLSLLLLYSTASSSRTYGLSSICLKQLSWLGLGLAVISITLWCDYQSLSRYAYLFYSVVVASLIAVLLFAPVINGAQRWLSFGPWRLQTSELVKPALILVLARYFSRDRKQPASRLAHALGTFTEWIETGLDRDHRSEPHGLRGAVSLGEEGPTGNAYLQAQPAPWANGWGEGAR